MSYISDAHNEWHTVNGWNAMCPLDCGAGERYYDDEPETVVSFMIGGREIAVLADPAPGAVRTRACELAREHGRAVTVVRE